MSGDQPFGDLLRSWSAAYRPKTNEEKFKDKASTAAVLLKYSAQDQGVYQRTLHLDTKSQDYYPGLENALKDHFEKHKVRMILEKTGSFIMLHCDWSEAGKPVEVEEQ